MKYGRSLVEIATEIQRQAQSKQDFIASTKQLAMLEDGKTVAVENIGTFPVADLALTQIGERTGIPAKYLRRMQAEAPRLLASNVNHWFTQTPERRMVRTLDGSLRAFLSDRYMRVDNTDVAEAVLPVLHQTEGLRILSTEVTEHRLYLKASSTLVIGEIKSRRVGDLVEAGVMITNSEVGLGAIRVTPFAHFLVCLNGMTREGGARWNHIGRHADERDDVYALLSDEAKQADDRALLLKVRDTLKAALDPARFQHWLLRVQSTTSNRIEGDVTKAVEALSNKLALTNGEQSSVLKHLIEGGDLSQYGLMNAVTRTAEDAPSYDRASELEAAGAVVLDLRPTEWRELSQQAA
jgi:hypothetical protein